MPTHAAPLPPLSAVRAFEAAARHGSFTRAAAELNMTQAAVSYQIKLLEERLGLALFQRQARQVVLTREGERLASAAISAFDGLRKAFTEVQAGSDGVLVISALPTVASAWLAPRLGAFQLAHPQLAVRLQSAIDTVDLLRHEADVAIRSGLGEWPGLEAHFLWPNLFAPLCSPAMVAGLAGPADLLKCPLIGRTDWWRLWFAQAGLPDVDLGGHSSMDFGVQQLEVAAAAAGQGVAIASPLMFAAELASGRLAQPFAQATGDGKSHWLVYPAARARSPKIRAFRDWVLAQGDVSAAPGGPAAPPQRP